MDRRVARSEIARPSPGRSRMVIRSLAGPVSDTVRIGNRSAHSRSHRTPRSARADSDTPCLFASSLNSAFSSSGTRIVMVGPVAGAEASLMRSPEICVFWSEGRIAAWPLLSHDRSARSIRMLKGNCPLGSHAACQRPDRIGVLPKRVVDSRQAIATDGGRWTWENDWRTRN